MGVEPNSSVVGVSCVRSATTVCRASTVSMLNFVSSTAKLESGDVLSERNENGSTVVPALVLSSNVEMEAVGSNDFVEAVQLMSGDNCIESSDSDGTGSELSDGYTVCSIVGKTEPTVAPGEALVSIP